MAIDIVSLALTTTGSSGSASATGTLKPPSGSVAWIYLDYHASAPSTTDVTITYATTPPGGTLLVLTDNNTDGLYMPRAGAVSTTGAAISGSYVPFPVFGPLTVSVAQCDALTAAVTVYLAVEH